MHQPKRTRKYLKPVLWMGVPLIAGTLAYASLPRYVEYPESPEFRNGAFHNIASPVMPKVKKMPALWLRFLFETRAEAKPKAPLPVSPITVETLETTQEGTLYRLGHSTVLMKLNGQWWLTDPIFSERASPVSWAGPKRFHPPPIALEALPDITAVILSHDHYDHLDKATIKALSGRVGKFLAPLGVGDILIQWGVPKDKVIQLDWWQEKEIGGVKFTSVPSQHFSGRLPFNRNRTLWTSWVIKSAEYNLFFSGDTGYHKEFKEIGERFGPFDITMLEIGAYDQMWPGVHMHPHQVIQAYKDLQGRYLMPIHNGTFDLGFHAWDEPFNTITALCAENSIPLTLPIFGEPVSINHPPKITRWWQPNNQ